MAFSSFRGDVAATDLLRISYESLMVKWKETITRFVIAIFFQVSDNPAFAEDNSVELGTGNDREAISTGLRRIEDGSVISNSHTVKWRLFTDKGRDLFLKGKYEEAENYFLSALQEAKDGFGQRDAHVASSCNNLIEAMMIAVVSIPTRNSMSDSERGTKNGDFGNNGVGRGRGILIGGFMRDGRNAGINPLCPTSLMLSEGVMWGEMMARFNPSIYEESFAKLQTLAPAIMTTKPTSTTPAVGAKLAELLAWPFVTIAGRQEIAWVEADLAAAVMAYKSGKIPWCLENEWHEARRSMKQIRFSANLRESNFRADQLAGRRPNLHEGEVEFHAELYRVRRAFHMAEPLYLEAINILEESYGLEDIRVGAALHNLGQFYLVQRKLEDARVLYEIKGRVLGHGHTEYADTMYHLGTVTYLQGMEKDAMALFEDSIRILEISLKSNNFVEAEIVQRKILHIMELSKGWNSLETVVAAESLALTLQSVGKLKEAQEFLERCLDVRKTLLDENHIQIGGNMLHMGTTRMLNSNRLRKVDISEARAELNKAKAFLDDSVRYNL
ncbi:hypothetical protein GIB67_020888 [Kingdonia uniflora]|uniref:MalT-like TPR region domain-containing protein n=1 Tax=Kingdonia uniflora TaxID=39325 RepID=A0A7J7M7E9_9MAGN|nr:hypothetical protein GIB67_020888 [Kingdonia uniflora]